MKKVLFALVVVAAGFASTSCSKEKDCECVTSYSDPSYPSSTTNMTINDGDCSDANSSVSSGGVTVTTKCTEQ